MSTTLNERGDIISFGEDGDNDEDFSSSSSSDDNKYMKPSGSKDFTTFSLLVTNLVCIYIAVRLQKSSRIKRASSNASEEEFYEDIDEVEEEYYEAEQQMLKAKEEAELRHQEEERRRLAYVPREVTIRQLFRLQNVCYKILSMIIYITYFS